ncbi:hypothetical protein [Rhodanobacter sp. 115]|nr:hypothetical protein [Rhodanobacter sp. 115]
MDGIEEVQVGVIGGQEVAQQGADSDLLMMIRVHCSIPSGLMAS